MNFLNNVENQESSRSMTTRSHSAQGLRGLFSSSAMKIPLPPRLWITDVEGESSDGSNASNRDEGVATNERARVRSRFRHYKQRSSIPIGIFWDIENCQVPRGCSAIDVVAAIRAKFLTGRREADFVVVCDVRKESANRLQELNDAQISLIHVCGTQKNAADEKLRQCMRRFGELHSAPAALLLISGDINFAADLSDFRHRKNMEVILVHKQNTSTALIACASTHYCFNELIAHLPRNPKSLSQTEEDEPPTCEMEVVNLPLDQPPERVSRRLRRLADNCGGKILKVNANIAVLRFPTPDHASRALKRMDGEDVFGRKISTRFARSVYPPAYSSDEGYSTAPPPAEPPRPVYQHTPRPLYQNTSHTPVLPLQSPSPCEPAPAPAVPAGGALNGSAQWALALQQLPAPSPPPLNFCPPPAPRPRKIRGTHGSVSLDRSGCSSSNSGDESRRDLSASRAVSPWNCSGYSEHSEDEGAELTVSNLPPYEPHILQEMLTQLFSQHVGVVRVSVWPLAEGPLGRVCVRSEWDARVAISRLHKRRLEPAWSGRRLELSFGCVSPAPATDLSVLRARLRAILLDQKNHSLPIARLRDAYAARHGCTLSILELMKVKDTVVINEMLGRIVQLVDLSPVPDAAVEEAQWKCKVHAGPGTSHEDVNRILQPVFIKIDTLAKNVHVLLKNHGGMVPLLSFVECYEAAFGPLAVDGARGVCLELLLRSVPGADVRDQPCRHLALCAANDQRLSESTCSSGEREPPRTAPALEPMLTLFERELVDLLRNAPRCCIAFSKLIPDYHHHFGRQCRVADYGYTRLPDLLAALGKTIVVLGSGSSRMITLTPAAQGRRWTSDLLKLLKANAGRPLACYDIPQLYAAAFKREFSPADYGVCTAPELLQRAAHAVLAAPDGTVALPPRPHTPLDAARTHHFAMQAVELLCCTPNLRMEFSRFVPEYHAHFGRQLRVAHYGCVKLLELFELIPDYVAVGAEPSGEKHVRLAPKTARKVMVQRLQALGPLPLERLASQYALQFGAAPQPAVLGAASLEALVLAAGGAVLEGLALPPGRCPRWAEAALAAAAVLVADRSVARSSTRDYFVSAFRRLAGAEPWLQGLEAAGVLELRDGVQLTPEWRAVWRLAQLLHERSPRTVGDLLQDYTARYEPTFCGGPEGVTEFLCSHVSVFSVSEGAGGEERWSLSAGVSVPPPPSQPLLDYSVFDTPPGQKGSSVFESPRPREWCSPPASALPAPTALLARDKRRTRLAAYFDAA